MLSEQQVLASLAALSTPTLLCGPQFGLLADNRRHYPTSAAKKLIKDFQAG